MKTLCKLKLFLEKVLKKQKSEAQSSNMIGRSMKTYLFRPIKILHFLTPGILQKCLHNFKTF